MSTPQQNTTPTDQTRVFWPIGWPHEAPENPKSPVPLAHAIMQSHLDCHLDSCARKRWAYRTLAEEGVLTPDLRAEKYLQ